MKKIIITIVNWLYSFYILNFDNEESRYHTFIVNKKGKFSFYRECIKRRLDPKTTKVHEVECLILGLDPKNTTDHELECISLGLDPKTSEHDLKCYKWNMPMGSSEHELWNQIANCSSMHGR